MKKFALSVFLILTFFSCENRRDNVSDTVENIVIVDAGNASRSDVATMLTQISKCSPLVVGIDFIYKTKPHDHSDSALEQSIRSLPLVVLLSVIEEGKIIRSDPYFTTAAKFEGMTTFGVVDGEAMSEVIFKSYKDSLLYSFSYMLAFLSGLPTSDLMGKIKGNRYYRITDSHPIKNFKILTIPLSDTDLCSKIERKIVIIGSVEVDPRGVFKDAKGNPISRMEVLGNCVQNLLEGKIDEDE